MTSKWLVRERAAQKSFSSHSVFPLNSGAIDKGKLKSEYQRTAGTKKKGWWEWGDCHNCVVFIKHKEVVSSLSLLAQKKKNPSICFLWSGRLWIGRCGWRRDWEKLKRAFSCSNGLLNLRHVNIDGKTVAQREQFIAVVSDSSRHTSAIAP